MLLKSESYLSIENLNIQAQIFVIVILFGGRLVLTSMTSADTLDPQDTF